ncbi:MAG TPA: hypothetical protein VJ400_05885 [Thermoplasmata archaeon]|nr:hypothetical protein [Thermoplasmata archaeon]
MHTNLVGFGDPHRAHAISGSTRISGSTTVVVLHGGHTDRA